MKPPTLNLNNLPLNPKPETLNPKEYTPWRSLFSGHGCLQLQAIGKMSQGFACGVLGLQDLPIGS